MTLPLDIGTIPQWLTGGAIVTFMGLVFKRDVQVRGLKNADAADIRDHYADELRILRERLDAADRRYLEQQKLADDRWHEARKNHEECERDRQLLRDELAGLRRQIIRYSAGAVTVLEAANCPSENVTDAARRVRDITDES